MLMLNSDNRVVGAYFVHHLRHYSVIISTVYPEPANFHKKD